MGQSSSRSQLTPNQIRKPSMTSPIDAEDKRLEELRDIERPKLYLNQIELISSSWKMAESDIEKVGVVMFIQLFETHPDVRDTFTPFRGLPASELQYSSILKAHALRVMGTVEKVLARIDQRPKLIAMLHDLGRKHATYKAKREYFDLIGPQFLFAIRPSIESIWSDELEEAWLTLFRFVTHVMREVIYD
ncbi:DgyrCDS9883 [Dimorphilus gyrociliatus]|uniref:DgyrCDS9883 n=1 Tax=Dimorphilus gyrociliatus TaxID=2664684 RepID=A0A7I8VZZ4_9ANNE|nr:DgyrCDS9883 [Dimorphilus gyrociliatus]